MFLSRFPKMLSIEFHDEKVDIEFESELWIEDNNSLKPSNNEIDSMGTPLTAAVSKNVKYDERNAD